MLSIKPFSLASLKTDTISSNDHRKPLLETLNSVYSELSMQQTALAKNQYLHQLLDKNELLFYTFVRKHLKELLPILYTPTVGSVVCNFNQLRSNTRGLYISWQDRDYIEDLLLPYSDKINIAILTDGERILGLGDQGVGGIEICIAKAMMYVLCGSIAPYRLLPIYLDVGTNNPQLLNDANYKGWRHPRLLRQDYNYFIDRIVTALHKKFPNIYLHWEDLEGTNAKHILDCYQSRYCIFNDDMQGTGVVTLAGALRAFRITQVPLTQQRIIIVGGGNAGLGIAKQLCDAMQRMGLTQEKARDRIWLIGRYGLLFSDSDNLNELQKPYARPFKERSLYNTVTVELYTVVKQIHPTFLIGCSGKAGMFTEAIIKKMADQVARPIIFPLSNPTQCCEAMPEDILNWTEGRALIATGSPFEEVTLNETVFSIAQCNNALAFPGIGLGIQASGTPLLTDDILWEACLQLSKESTNESLLPQMADIYSVTQRVACAVYQSVQKTSHSCMLKHIENQGWKPLMQ